MNINYKNTMYIEKATKQSTPILKNIETLDMITNRGVDTCTEKELAQIKEDLISYLPPISVAVAAKLLSVSRPTIYSWVSAGSLTIQKTDKKTTVEPKSFYELYKRVGGVRSEGKKRDLTKPV